MAGTVTLRGLNDFGTDPVNVGNLPSHSVSSLNQGTRHFLKLTYFISVNCQKWLKGYSAETGDRG